MFAQKRPPGIYKQEYIEALYTFYHESPENLNCPPTPEWKKSSDLDLNGEAVADEDDDGNTEAPLHVCVAEEFFYLITLYLSLLFCSSFSFPHTLARYVALDYVSNTRSLMLEPI